MGCGISKSELEERGQGLQIRSIRRRHTEESKEDDFSESFTSRQRKSVSSMASEGGTFLRRVLGTLEKERGVERDAILDSSDDNNHNINNVGLKCLSSSSTPRILENSNNNNNAFCLIKQPHLETMDDKSVVVKNKEVVEKQESIRRTSNVEASILFGPGSPSFRVYCVRNDFIASTYEGDNSDEEREEIKSTKEIEKGSETVPVAKRGRRGRGFRNAMNMGGTALGLRSVFVQMGGSAVARKNNVLSGLSRTQNATLPSNEDTTKLIPKNNVLSGLSRTQNATPPSNEDTSPKPSDH